ncbi:MAG TPA: hypothetical protein VGM56_12260 [Byssovorax sp.]|jgi:hypothetical protein
MKSALLLAALALAACADPVHDEAVAALGPEAPGVSPGPLHRAGQPCLVCHDGSGPADAVFSFGGTLYQVSGRGTPAVGAFVHLRDEAASTYLTESNCVGNFFVQADDYTPVDPVHVSVSFETQSATMQSHIGRDGSCASCHTGDVSQSSVDHVYVAQGPFTWPPSGCP